MMGGRRKRREGGDGGRRGTAYHNGERPNFYLTK
jgi:hypothetical protein